MNKDATAEAEAYLRKDRARLIANNVLPNQVRVIDRLLNARAEMSWVYNELWRNLNAPGQRNRVIGALTFALRDPNICNEVREQMERTERLNEEIAEKARELAELLRVRNRACPHIRKPDDCHPVDLIERATQYSDHPHTRGLFNSYLKPKLDRLNHQFDMKYWPETADLLEALADAQDDILPVPHDDVTSSAIDNRTKSEADMVRALLVVIDDLRNEPPTMIPGDFSLSHESVARVLNAALDTCSFNAGRIKTIRSRMRKPTDEI